MCCSRHCRLKLSDEHGLATIRPKASSHQLTTLLHQALSPSDDQHTSSTSGAQRDCTALGCHWTKSHMSRSQPAQPASAADDTLADTILWYPQIMIVPASEPITPRRAQAKRTRMVVLPPLHPSRPVPRAKAPVRKSLVGDPVNESAHLVPSLQPKRSLNIGGATHVRSTYSYPLPERLAPG